MGRGCGRDDYSHHRRRRALDHRKKRHATPVGTTLLRRQESWLGCWFRRNSSGLSALEGLRTMKKIVFFLILLSTVSLNTFAQTKDEKDVDNTKDPVTSLREQIEGAGTPVDRIRLQLKLADLLVSTGHRSQALAELKLIADSNEFDPTGFYNLGNSYARLGETEAAINAYNVAIEQRKGRYSRAYNNLGVVLLRTGRWDDAQDALLSALKVENFRYAEASYNLGRVYSARGQRDLAAREWKRALFVDPQHDAAAQALTN